MYKIERERERESQRKRKKEKKVWNKSNWRGLKALYYILKNVIVNIPSSMLSPQ